MSSPIPKSESTTSLLKSSGLNRRSAHSDHGPHGHRSHRSHHHATAAGAGAAGGRDAGWTVACEPSARRPLCQPRHSEIRNAGDQHQGQKNHSHRQTSVLDDGYAREDARHKSRNQKERSKSSRSKHHDSARGELPPAAHHQGGSRQDRRTSPTPSYPKHQDDAAFFFEPRERVMTESSSSLCSEPPATSAAVSSRKSKRLSATSSEYESSLHPIVKSVFGQVRGQKHVLQRI